MTTATASKLSSASNATAIDAAVNAFKIGIMRSPDDRIDLRYGVYKQGASEPDQYIVFVNGRSEYIEKYAYLAPDFELPAGTGFLTWDHRGQGASGGARAFVDSYETYAQDAKHIISQIVGTKPYILLTHSMGGLVGLTGVLTGLLAPRAMILSSPLLGLPAKPIPPRVAKPIAKLLTSLGLGPIGSGAGGFGDVSFEDNVLTHNVELFKRFAATPYPLPSATFAWVSATFQAVDICFDPKRLSQLTVPTLVMGAGQEQVVDPNCSRTWFQTATQHSKALLHLAMFPTAKHELFAESPTFYSEAVATARSWIKSYLSGL